jgi:RNA polymerase sigma-70 factor, ECF subfamily
MSDDVARLVDRARNDRRAFAELLCRFEEAAFGWALRLLDDPEEARDATQEAFLAAWLRLPTLREPAAFGAWLKRLVATECRRVRRKRGRCLLEQEPRTTAGSRFEHRRMLAAAMAKLSGEEHRAIVLHYFFGRTVDEIARILGVPRGTAGKRLYSARLRIRRQLPLSAREEFLRMRQARADPFDEYLGEYRFDERPELVVRIEREGPLLVSDDGHQRTVLASIADNALVTTAFDGEGRFERDCAGRVTQFVYYEFGARLGVARKVDR